MASGPARKRAVAVARAVSEVAAKRPATRVRRTAPNVVVDEAPAHNYALRLAESVEDTNVAEDNFALA